MLIRRRAYESVQIRDSVENLIEHYPLLDRAPVHHSLADITGLLQRARRRRVLRERNDEDTFGAERLKPS